MSTQPKYSPGMVYFVNNVQPLQVALAFGDISSSKQLAEVGLGELVLILSLEPWKNGLWDYCVLTQSGKVGWMFGECLSPTTTTKEEDQ